MSLAFQVTSRGFTAPPVATGWRGRLRSLVRPDFQLFGALALGVVLPLAARAQYGVGALGNGAALETALWTFGLILVATLVQRRMTAHPGVQPQAPVLPVFGVAIVGGAIGFWLFGSLQSLLQFAAGLLAATAWLYVATGIEQTARARLLLVRAGNNWRPARNGGVWPIAVSAAQLQLPLGEFTGDRHRPNFESVDWVVARTTTEVPPNFDGVVADLDSHLPEEWEELITRRALGGVPVYDTGELSELLTGRVEIERLSEINLISRAVPATYVGIKQAVDITVAVATLPLVLVIWAAVAVAIKLDDGGPVLFPQARTGFRGKTFTMFKFRTMRQGVTGGHSTGNGDPRITTVGRVLRRFRIDEVPQVLNILRGEMSWIGPRPEPISLAEWYRRGIPFYDYRHSVRPGIAGWAQVNQGYVEADLVAGSSKLHHDFYYIKNLSPWLDLLIGARTVRVVITGFGAR